MIWLDIFDQRCWILRHFWVSIDSRLAFCLEISITACKLTGTKALWDQPRVKILQKIHQNSKFVIFGVKDAGQS